MSKREHGSDIRKTVRIGLINERLRRDRLKASVLVSGEHLER